MKALLLLLSALPVTLALAQDAPGLVNGAFIGDADGNGIADGWSFAAGASTDKLEVSFGLEELPDGAMAQRMSCTRYDGGHAMLCQVGTVSVKAGQWYEVRLRARGESLRSVDVGLQDTNGWQHLGLWTSITLTRHWKDYALRFQAPRDGHETSRFQIWFTRPGTLWLSNVSLAQSEAPLPGNVIPTAGDRNLLPNGGFEIPGGWGMQNAWTYNWQVAEGKGIGGSNCAAVAWEPDDPELGYYFDYFEMVRRPLTRPWLQALGQLKLELGETYCLSAWMRVDPGFEGAPAMLGFVGPGARAEKKVSLTADWQRVTVTAKATGQTSLVQVGPAFEETDRERLNHCVVYIDNVQAEKATEPSDFEARALDVFLAHRSETAVADSPRDWPVTVHLFAREAGEVELSLEATDFSDATVADVTRAVPLRQGANAVPMTLRLPGPGFYRVNVKAQAGSQAAETSARWALYPAFESAEDTAFGINHAYAYNGFLKLAREIGIQWVRDWSLKWEHVETRKGEFTFDETDFQINRPITQGMKVLCMFPFPSAEWSSTAPEELRKDGYPGNRIRQAFAPTDNADLERYVEACVNRYKDRVDIWEVFNESIFTSYSLPKDHGYKPEDYVPLLKSVYAACKRADPDCQVMGGYSAPPDRIELYGPMFEEGGLEACDLVSIHSYPGGPPEGLEGDLERLNRMMDEAGGRRDLWMTEFAYYADDDCDVTSSAAWPRRLESEWLQACYNTRACVIMLGNGVRKVFYHIWPTRMNQDIGSRIFFEYAGAPRKIAVAQAAMRAMLGAAPRFISKRTWPKAEAFAYSFAAPEGGGTVTVCWTGYDSAPLQRLPGMRYSDTCGRLVADGPVTLSEAPIYIVSGDETPEAVFGSVEQALKDGGLL